MNDVPASAPIRVASVPAAHPYVQALGGADDGITRLADPVIDPAQPGRWWPPAMLDAGWIRDNADAFDLMHVHFGMESLPEGRLEAALRELAAQRRPLVYTAHDLSNPQLTDQARHDADLDLLMQHATSLITLTDGAAEEIADRWNRDAAVIPHPEVVQVDDGTPAGRSGGPYTVGVHLRDLRPSIDTVSAVQTLISGLIELRHTGVAAAGRVFVNDEVRDTDALAEVVQLVSDRPDCELVGRARVPDDELHREIADLDAAMLPYRHGTHSGWAELCWDLGVPVIGPEIGHMHEQHPDDYESYILGDARSLSRAVRAVLTTGTRPGSPERRELMEQRATARRAARSEIGRAHAEVYRRALASLAGDEA